MRRVELSHHGGDWSFEIFLNRYDLADPMLWPVLITLRSAADFER